MENNVRSDNLKHNFKTFLLDNKIAFIKSIKGEKWRIYF